MKKTVLVLSMSMMMAQAYAQAPSELVIDKAHISQELHKEAESGNHDKKTTKMLKKVANELNKLDECDSCSEKTKSQIVIRNVGRKLGKGSAWVTTATSKPFLNASGFLTGVFEKKDTNQDVIGLYTLFLNHSQEFDKLYLEADSVTGFRDLLIEKLDQLIKTKTKIITRDFLVNAGLKKEIPEDLSEFEITEAEKAKLDQTKLTPDFINNHPEFQELKGIVGEVTAEEIEDIKTSAYLDRSISFETYVHALPRIHEGVGTMAGQLFGPKIVLGVVSSTLAGLYATPVAFADIGSAIGSAICVKDQLSETPKYETDKDLAEFCSYVVNRSAYELMKSRARGYLAGKKIRVKIDHKIND